MTGSLYCFTASLMMLSSGLGRLISFSRADGIEGGDSKKTAPARGDRLRPPSRNPRRTAACSSRVFLAPARRQAQESKLPPHESFRPNLEAGQAGRRE
jgi:hypothetical protein